MYLPTTFRINQVTLFVLPIITIIIVFISFDFLHSNVLRHSVNKVRRMKTCWDWSEISSSDNTQFSSTSTTESNIEPSTESVDQLNSNLNSETSNQTTPISVNEDLQIVGDENLLINTSGCALPKTELYPEGFVMTKDYGPNCHFERRIVTIDDTNEVLRLNAVGKNALVGESKNACLVFKINRPPKKDWFEIGKTMFNLTKTEPLNISDIEMFGTKCGQFVNFDAHFPLNNQVQEKINFWKKQETDQANPLPISVLLVGFDSVSRSHFHRSLQETLPLLTQMGFIDFKGYQTIIPNTLDNFYAFLMGLKGSQIRETCAKQWSDPYDACPVIWKDFAKNNYVTMYTEDGDQSFNWGGRGGFLDKPTDYYTHPMFTAVQDYRLKSHNQTTDESCPSSMNNPTFLLDYTRRFVKKFMKTPFFSLTWLAYPFHENTYSLYGLDRKVKTFFKFLNSNESKELRERTLIVLNSDHGERTADFIQKGYKEGSIERSLPGLFIRLPDNLLKQYPELNLVDTLKVNSERLTSGFDLHHTFLHLLKIRDLQILAENQNSSIAVDHEFEPVLSDRSSLLLPVSDKRTCADLNIDIENCACTIIDSSNASTTKLRQFRNNTELFFNTLVKFAVFELNSMVNSSKYRDICQVHKKMALSFVSWNVKIETDKFTHGYLRFLTHTRFSNKALFEVQLRVPHAKAVVDMKGITRRGSFNRLNRYGDISWCVEFETDADKKMKELCHCKRRKGDV